MFKYIYVDEAICNDTYMFTGKWMNLKAQTVRVLEFNQSILIEKYCFCQYK